MENQQPLKWQALEFEYFKKSSEWFWALWIIAVGVIVFAIFFDSILFAVLVFVMAFTISLQATRKPKIENFEINHKSIVTPYKKYDFKNLESYWIKEDDSFPRIILKSKSLTSPISTIPIGDTNSEEIDNFLSEYLEKEEIQEPIPYSITRYF